MPGTAPRPGSPAGGVITPAGFVPPGTFAVLATIPATFLTELDFAIAFGILLDTTVVRSVLVTARTLGPGPLEASWPTSPIRHQPNSARNAPLPRSRAGRPAFGLPSLEHCGQCKPRQAQPGLPDVISPGCKGPVALPATVGGSFVGGM